MKKDGKKPLKEESLEEEQAPEIKDIPENEPAGTVDTQDTVQDKADEYKALSEEYLAMAQRIQAEFDNYRKRTASVRQTSIDEGVRKAALAILPALDNMERAISMLSDQSDTVKDGLQMIYRQLLDSYTSLEVTEINALGQPFDPNLHNAVMQDAGTEDFPSGTVMEVFQKGYMLKDSVLRHSLVKVAN